MSLVRVSTVEKDGMSGFSNAGIPLVVRSVAVATSHWPSVVSLLSVTFARTHGGGLFGGVLQERVVRVRQERLALHDLRVRHLVEGDDDPVAAVGACDGVIGTLRRIPARRPRMRELRRVRENSARPACHVRRSDEIPLLATPRRLVAAGRWPARPDVVGDLRAHVLVEGGARGRRRNRVLVVGAPGERRRARGRREGSRTCRSRRGRSSNRDRSG